MKSMPEIGDAIRSNASELLNEWPEITSAEPWLELPTWADLDNLPDMLVKLAETALVDPTDFEKRRGFVGTAAMHGEHRRSQSLPDKVILHEHHLLRRAIARFVTRITHGSNVAYEAIARVDVTTTIASRAALMGYHRDEYERQGRWPDALEQLCREWDPPWR
jgi:hypothetical protein